MSSQGICGLPIATHNHKPQLSPSRRWEQVQTEKGACGKHVWRSVWVPTPASLNCPVHPWRYDRCSSNVTNLASETPNPDRVPNPCTRIQAAPLEFSFVYLIHQRNSKEVDAAGAWHSQATQNASMPHTKAFRALIDNFFILLIINAFTFTLLNLRGLDTRRFKVGDVSLSQSTCLNDQFHYHQFHRKIWSISAPGQTPRRFL